MMSNDHPAGEIQRVVKKLCTEGTPDDENWLESLDEGLGLISHLHSDSMGGADKTMALDLETAGVGLWNHAVGLRIKGSLTPVTSAKLRHLSFMMVTFANQGMTDEDTLKKQIIAIWSNSSKLLGDPSTLLHAGGLIVTNAHHPQEAETVLNISNQCAQKLHSVVIEKKNEGGGGTDMVERMMMDVERDRFKLLCYEAEVAVSLFKNDVAVDLVQMAKQMLPRFPREGGFLSMLCYNFGVDNYKRKQYDETISWLRESFELGKDRKTTPPKNQARTLRLLANAYVEGDPSNSLEKALNAVSLANTEHCHPAGLYLKLRILLMGGEKGTQVSAVLDEIIKHQDCTLDLGLSVIQLLKQNNELDTLSDFSAMLMKRFEQSADAGRILISQLQALLQHDKIQQAKEFAEECITAHNTGKILDISTRKHFHLVFWEQAATAFENSKFDEALIWYNYSLSMFSPSEMVGANMAKLERNRSSCFLHMGQLAKAKETIQHAERFSSEDAHTQFIIYKIALAENDHATANVSLEKMVKGVRGTQNVSESHTFGLICLAAQTAIEQNSSKTACMALDFLITHSSDNTQVLTALRCVVRLQLAQADSQNFCSESLHILVPLIRTAYNKLLIMRQQQTEGGIPVHIQEEATWFMKIAWNLALKCENDPFALKEFFSLCLKLLSLLPCDRTLLSRQKTCSLMAAAGCLQVARTVTEDAEKKEGLEEALHHIAVFKELQREHSITWVQPEGSASPDTTDILLLLYEFEARVKLKDAGAEAVLERALTLPHPEPKTFEAIAALAVESPASDKSLSVRALKVAIRTHLQMESPDFQRCSKDIHSLIQLSMSTGQGSNKQEAFSYFQETLDVIGKKAKGLYPEIEILWLMTKAWNCGIQFYSSADFDEAERWCSLSMSLLKYLSTMKTNYEDQMNTVYGEVLARIEQARGKSTLEE